MRRPGMLDVLFALATVGLLTALVRAQRPSSLVQQQSITQQQSGGGYTGSESCQSCHQSAYDTWRKTLHVQMTKPIAEARVEGDFSYGSRFESPYGRTYTMERRDGRYFVSIARRKQPAQRFEVNYTLGARRFQGYLSKLP